MISKNYETDICMTIRYIALLIILAYFVLHGTLSIDVFLALMAGLAIPTSKIQEALK